MDNTVALDRWGIIKSRKFGSCECGFDPVRSSRLGRQNVREIGYKNQILGGFRVAESAVKLIRGNRAALRYVSGKDLPCSSPSNWRALQRSNLQQENISDFIISN